MFKFYRSVLAAGVVALGLAACGDDVTVTNPPPAPPPGVTSVTVTPNNAVVAIGQDIQLGSQVVADSGVSILLTWTSSNTAVATVNAATGLVHGVTAGTTTIVATSQANAARSAAVQVTVQSAVPGITSFGVTPPTLSLAAGASFQPSVQLVTQSGTTAAVTWASSNTAVATVNTTTGAITGVAAGTATITATATATPGGGTTTATIGVTVTATTPPGVVAFTVSPATLTLAPGQSSQATATVQMAPGFTPLTVSWISLTPGIATVNSTGLITGVTQGTAVVTATISGGGVTLTGSVAVTVGAGASISIASITQGASSVGSVCPGVVGAPVVLSNVACQIDVNLNLNAGVQPLDSMTVSIKQGAIFKRAAKQIYNNTIPSSGPVTLSILTGTYTKNPAAGTAAVDFFNGPTSITVQLFPHLGIGGTVVNCQIGANDPTCAGISSLILNNIDGWAADITKCSSVIATGVVCPAAVPAAQTGGFAVAANNGNPATVSTTFWGGPTPTGQTTAEIYPVIYNDNPAFAAGSSLNRCNNTLGNGTGCISSVTWSIGAPVPTSALQVTAVGPPPVIGPVNNTPGTLPNGCPLLTQVTLPFKQTFGTGAGATNACANYQNVTSIRDNIVIVASIDGQNNPFTTVGKLTGPVPIAPGAAINTALIPNTVIFGSTPDSGRFDYCLSTCMNVIGAPGGPGAVTTPTTIGAEGFNFVNANWQFTPAGTLVTDFGVGPAPATYAVFASASGGSVTTFPTLVTNGSQLAETNQNCAGAGCDGYNVRAIATDLLGNPANSGVSGAFGVDRTAPLLRISTVAAPSSFPSAYTSGGISTILDSTTYNAVAGVYGANVVTPGAQSLFLSAAIGTNDSLRVESIDARSGISRFVESTVRFAQGGTNGLQTTVYSTSNGVPGPSTIDGWLPAPALNVFNGRLGVVPPATAGYYTTTEYVIDRAGNVSGCPAVGSAAFPINISGVGGIGSICAGATAGSIAPSTTIGTNPAVTGGGSANLFARRTLALDPGQPLVTGVSPNNSYTGNSAQTFALGAQDDLEVIDSRLRIQYPNLTIGDAAATASPGLVWSYSLSSSFLGSAGSPNGNTCNGPTASNPTAGNCGFGYFLPIGIKFDNSIINPIVTGLGTTPVMSLDQFTLNVQETCLGAASPVGTCANNGDPISSVTVPFTKPSNIGVQVRDVFGSWVFNTTAGTTPSTGVSAEFVSPILPATVANPGGYSVSYINAGPATSCPQGGVVQPINTVSCVSTGINFRAEPSLSSGSTKVFRSTEALATTLPIFSRVDLYGLNAANEWVFIQRCTVPNPILPNTGAQGCGNGTVTGLDNGNERYWLYSFSSVASAGFTQFRAIGVNTSGFGLASTRQP